MKRILLIVLACAFTQLLSSQNVQLKDFTADGKKFFLEFVDVKDNITIKDAILVDALKKDWGKWQQVSTIEEADFILRVEATLSVGFHFTRTVAVKMDFLPSIKTIDGEVLWQGKSFRANKYTVENAYEKACEKLFAESFAVEMKAAFEEGTVKKSKKDRKKN